MTSMDLSDHDLSQLDEEELLKLPEEVLRRLSVRLLNDLKEARERLKQNSRNSSRPPSSEVPWERERTASDSTDELEEGEVRHCDDETDSGESKDSDRRSKDAAQEPSEEARKPGKQPGAEGFGRQQTLVVTGQEEHDPDFCACCGLPLNTEDKKAWTAFETLEVGWADDNHPGLRLSNIRTMKFPADAVMLPGANRIEASGRTVCRRSLAVNGVWSVLDWPP